jgi:hypothetical protein
VKVDYISNVSEENSVSIFRVVLFLDDIFRERGKVTWSVSTFGGREDIGPFAGQ